MKSRFSTGTNLIPKTLEMKLAILQDQFAVLEQKFNDLQGNKSTSGEGATGKGTDAFVNEVCNQSALLSSGLSVR